MPQWAARTYSPSAGAQSFQECFIREWRQSNTERGKFGIGGRQSGMAFAVRECDLFVLGLEQLCVDVGVALVDW